MQQGGTARWITVSSSASLTTGIGINLKIRNRKEKGLGGGKLYNQKVHRLDSAQDVLRMVRRKRISTAAIVTLVMELTSAYRR